MTIKQRLVKRLYARNFINFGINHFVKYQCPLLFICSHLQLCCGSELPTCFEKNSLNTKVAHCSTKSCPKYLNYHSRKYTMESEIHFTNLERVGLLNNDHILIKDKEKVDKIIALLLQGSFDSLQLVVDFDYTLTRGHFNGEKSYCSWGILDNSLQMPPFYRKSASELLAKYYPIEVDANKTEAEKIPYMVEWYQHIVELLKKCNISKEILSDMVSTSNVKLRENTDKLFKKLKDENVPMLIFSAGMGDILEHVLWHFDVYSENVKVVSNFFKYNETGIMVGFNGDLIHMFNKNENAIHSSDYFSKLVQKRNNVILMGDSIGDIKMADGVPKSSTVLKIGFYNHNDIGERISQYTDAFDIVLVGDQTMDIVNAILEQMMR